MTLLPRCFQHFLAKCRPLSSQEWARSVGYVLPPRGGGARGFELHLDVQSISGIIGPQLETYPSRRYQRREPNNTLTVYYPLGIVQRGIKIRQVHALHVNNAYTKARRRGQAPPNTSFGPRFTPSGCIATTSGIFTYAHKV